MKQRKVEQMDDKTKEFIYCVLIVLCLILLLLGDQIALRFIKKNPNPNNSVFGNKEKELDYNLDFLEATSLHELNQKIERGEKVVLLFTRSSCETCKIYLPDLKEVFQNYGIHGYFMNPDDMDRNSKEYEAFLSFHENISNRISYTPYLLFFENGELRGDIVGRMKKNEIEDFIIKYEMIN